MEAYNCEIFIKKKILCVADQYNDNGVGILNHLKG